MLQDELFKKKAECFQLQNRLDGTAESLRKIVDYQTTTSSLSEDKELNQAMDAQKAINRYLNCISSELKLKENFLYLYIHYCRHLLEEFQTEKEKWKEEKEKMSSQLVKLLEENEKYQNLLAIEFDKNPQCDAILQSDMNKLNHDKIVCYYDFTSLNLVKKKKKKL